MDRLLVMNQGRLAMDEKPDKVFSRYKELEEIPSGCPSGYLCNNALRKRALVLIV